ncbi:MAG: hypothetical protein R6U51_05740 [Anaerolineales bacterium]
MNVLLKEARNQLDVDAADVLLYNPGFQQLEYAAASGYKTQFVEGITLRIGEGFAGRAVSRRELVHKTPFAPGNHRLPAGGGRRT